MRDSWPKIREEILEGAKLYLSCAATSGICFRHYATKVAESSVLTIGNQIGINFPYFYEFCQFFRLSVRNLIYSNTVSSIFLPSAEAWEDVFFFFFRNTQENFQRGSYKIRRYDYDDYNYVVLYFSFTFFPFLRILLAFERTLAKNATRNMFFRFS